MSTNPLLIPLPSESEAPDSSRKVNPIIQSLIDTAYNALVSNLQGYGNTLSKNHRIALYELVATYGLMINGVRHGRLAFGIDTGMGKSESIVALVTAIHRLNLDDVSVLICQAKVEGLCELKRKMMRMGVPESKIGLIHSYKYDESKLDDRGRSTDEDYASLPSTPLSEQRQFQLVTHNRVRGDTDLTKYNTYHDQPRSFAIWDESLLVADTVRINEKDLRVAILSLGVNKGVKQALL